MGFLRMAAKVDNFRKSSGSGSGEYEGDAKAAVLQAMLPALTPFERAEEVSVSDRRIQRHTADRYAGSLNCPRGRRRGL